MTNSVILCNLGTTDPDSALGMEVWLDSQQVFNSDHVKENITLSITVDASDGEHELKFILKNKLSEHTKLDSDGNIIKDAMLTVSELKFDDIDLDPMLPNCVVYCHDYNGTRPLENDEFYGNMGCNGVASLKFTTPIYLWLLENM